MKTILGGWTAKRLERLYAHYNKFYWNGALPRCIVVPLVLPRRIPGMCDPFRKRIVIDVQAHKTRAEIYSTLLHEMAHIAVGRGGHGERFLCEVERLLERRAPVAGFGPRHPKRIPRCRFPLCRAAAEKRHLAHFRECIRSGAYGESVCERPGCGRILKTPKGRLFPRARFCGPRCRRLARNLQRTYPEQRAEM
jgi:hypothetical protein